MKQGGYSINQSLHLPHFFLRLCALKIRPKNNILKLGLNAVYKVISDITNHDFGRCVKAKLLAFKYRPLQ